MNWRGMLALVLLVVAILTGWSAWRDRGRETAIASTEARSDYVLRDFEMIVLGDDGQESFSLQAPFLEQEPGQNSILVETPLFLLPASDGGHWEGRSRTAWVSEDHNEVQLRDDVRFTSPEGHARPTTMTTTHLNVYPYDERARSEELVTIVQPGSTMSGVGLEVDMTANRITFLSNVRQRYEPIRP